MSDPTPPKSLNEVIAGVEKRLYTLLISVASACAEISAKLHGAGDVGAVGTSNKFGDAQLGIDVLADNVFFKHLKRSCVVSCASSEEKAEEHKLGGQGYSVAFDPLDGSSVVDASWAVGTIFGIWPGDGLFGRLAGDQVAAGYAIYGSRTVLVLTAEGLPGVAEFVMGPGGAWTLSRENMRVAEGKVFAPANLRASAENPGYRTLIQRFLDERYTLRYTGAMVPDVHHILVKGKGVFTYACSAKDPPKLRLLYECAPLAKVMEAAGGASSDGAGSLLRLQIAGAGHKVPVCLGSRDEVRRFEEAVGAFPAP
eukprot:tig00000545_g2001.t1